MSKMIQVWTNSLVGKALSHVLATMNHDSDAPLPEQQWPSARQQIRERLGLVVTLPEALAEFATPVTEPDVVCSLGLEDPTNDMLMAGAEALPAFIDNDEAKRLAADVFFAMMSRMPRNPYVGHDRSQAQDVA